MLRDVIDEAAPPKNKPPSDAAPIHPAVDLLRRYFATSDEALLNQAAVMIAVEKPGVSPATARKHPWLVIDKC